MNSGKTETNIRTTIFLSILEAGGFWIMTKTELIERQLKRRKLRKQRKIGFLLLGISVIFAILCWIIPALKGSDITALFITVPIALTMIFSKEVVIY
jgi:hypothetical protein